MQKIIRKINGFLIRIDEDDAYVRDKIKDFLL